jgi:hypothetical protein
MNGIKKTIFIVSIGKGYKEVEIAFEDIQKATDLFSYLTNANLPVLKEVGKGEKAFFFSGKFDVKIETKEVVLYKDEKSAKFAVFGDADNNEE